MPADCDDAHELEVLHGIEGLVSDAPLVEGEDAVASAVLHMWMCASADFFVAALIGYG